MISAARRDFLKATGAVVIGSLPVTTVNASTTAPQTKNWSQFQHDSANTGYIPDVAGPSTGITTNWLSSLGSQDSGIAARPAVANGTVYIGSWDDHVYALNAATGEIQWQRDLGDSISFPTPAVADNHLFVPTHSGFFALDAQTGTPRWQKQFKFGSVASPTVVGDLVLVSAAWAVYAFDIKTGEQVWAHRAASETELFGTAPATSDGIAYVVSSKLNHKPKGGMQALEFPYTDEGKRMYEEIGGTGRVYALDLQEGTVRWQTEVAGFPSPPTVADGSLYIGDWKNGVNALSLADGSQRWRYELDGVVTASPAVSNDTLYVSDWPGGGYALDTSDGSLVWQFVMPVHSAFDSPAATAEMVYFPGGDRLFGVDRQQGTIQWQYQTGTYNLWGPAVTDSGLYICDGPGRVFALTEGESTQATPPTGMSQMDGDAGESPVESIIGVANEKATLLLGGGIGATVSVAGILSWWYWGEQKQTAEASPGGSGQSHQKASTNSLIDDVDTRQTISSLLLLIAGGLTGAGALSQLLQHGFDILVGIALVAVAATISAGGLGLRRSAWIDEIGYIGRLTAVVFLLVPAVVILRSEMISTGDKFWLSMLTLVVFTYAGYATVGYGLYRQNWAWAKPEYAGIGVALVLGVIQLMLVVDVVSTGDLLQLAGLISSGWMTLIGANLFSRTAELQRAEDAEDQDSLPESEPVTDAQPAEELVAEIDMEFSTDSERPRALADRLRDAHVRLATEEFETAASRFESLLTDIEEANIENEATHELKQGIQQALIQDKIEPLRDQVQTAEEAFHAENYNTAHDAFNTIVTEVDRLATMADTYDLDRLRAETTGLLERSRRFQKVSNQLREE